MLLEGSIGLREVRKFEIVLCVVCVEGENWILKKKKKNWDSLGLA